MTAAERQAARDRCDKATPKWCSGCPETGRLFASGHSAEIAHFKGDQWERESNTRFAISARRDLPAALDALDAADKRIAELEESVQIGKENCATLIGFMDGKDALLGKAEERIAGLEADKARLDWLDAHIIYDTTCGDNEIGMLDSIEGFLRGSRNLRAAIDYGMKDRA